jgi:PKD repeat protein
MGGENMDKKDPGRFPDPRSGIESGGPGRCLIGGMVAAAVLVVLLVAPAMAIAPVADFTMTPSSGRGQAPLTVYFYDTSTGSAGERWWDFGDGSTSTLQNPVHQYPYTGTYTVTLTVYPPKSGNAAFLNPPEITKTVTVYRPTLTVSPSYGRAGTQVTVTGNSFDLYTVEFPYATVYFNGVVMAGNIPMTSSGYLGSFSTSFTVPAGTPPGTYTVRAIGPRDTVETGFTVTNIPPRALIDADPRSGRAPLPVHFSGTRSYDEDGSINSYQWDFGDGGSASGMTADHTYTRSGDYRARLTVTDNQGESGTAEVTISLGNLPPVAEAYANPISGSYPLDVSFDGSQSYDPDGTIVSYHWDFGDDYWERAARTSHQYRSPQSYTAVLTVTDDKGSTGTDEVEITVGNEPPVAGILISPQQGNAPLMVTFDGSQSYDPDDTDLTFLWDFGDGEGGSGPVLTHTYKEEGTYQVSLRVTDPDGATGTASAAVKVIPPFPWWAPVIGVLGVIAVAKVIIDRPRVIGPGQSLPDNCRFPEPQPGVEVHCGVECGSGKDRGLPDISVEVRSGILKKEEER